MQDRERLHLDPGQNGHGTLLGNSYIQSTSPHSIQGAWAAQQKTTTQMLRYLRERDSGDQLQLPASGGYTPAQRTYTYTYLGSSNYAELYIYNRLFSAAVTDGTNNLYLATLNYDCVTGCSTSGSGSPREWDSNYSSLQWRGNPTAIATVSGSTTVVYDLYGNTVSTTVNGVTSNASVTSATNYAARRRSPSAADEQPEYNDNFLGLTNETGPNGTSVSLGYDMTARPTSSSLAFRRGDNDRRITIRPRLPIVARLSTAGGRKPIWTGLRPILTLTGYGSSCGTGNNLDSGRNDVRSLRLFALGQDGEPGGAACVWKPGHRDHYIYL